MRTSLELKSGAMRIMHVGTINPKNFSETNVIVVLFWCLIEGAFND
jgi:hypothetical protein